jgi:hypothetical protein
VAPVRTTLRTVLRDMQHANDLLGRLAGHEKLGLDPRKLSTHFTPATHPHSRTGSLLKPKIRVNIGHHPTRRTNGGKTPPFWSF